MGLLNKHFVNIKISNLKFKNGSISFPNLFGKGEKGSFEYSYGSRSQSEYRFTYQSPLNMEPDKK